MNYKINKKSSENNIDIKKNFFKKISEDTLYKSRISRKINLLFLLIIIESIFLVYFIYNDLYLKNSEMDNLKEDVRSLKLSNIEIENKISELSKNLIETRMNLSKKIESVNAGKNSDFSGIIENAVNSVVSIRTNIAQGSGFIITQDGYVVTNAHVLAGARYADAIMSDQQINSMDLIGYNLTLDLALLKMDGNFDYLEIGNSNDVKLGEKVIAIGNPLGLSFSVTEGIISGIKRKGLNDIPAYFQTDAALNPGNSGGPLIASNGKVVGINNFKARGENLGFSLESNLLKEGINEISLKKLNKTILD
ncbi:MAG: S1C family serine protease [Candidatus Pacearchaeota archaeon]